MERTRPMRLTDNEFKEIVAEMTSAAYTPTLEEIAAKTNYATASGVKYRMNKLGIKLRKRWTGMTLKAR